MSEISFGDYRKTVSTHFNTYFRRIRSGQTGVAVGPCLYPTEIVYGDFGASFSFELIGAAPDFAPLIESQTKVKDVNSYIGQYEPFESPGAPSPLFDWPDGTTNTEISFATLTTEEGLLDLRSRYPNLRTLEFEGRSVLQMVGRSQCPVVHIGENCDDIRFEDVYLINGTTSGATRLKHLSLFNLHRANQIRRDLKRKLLTYYPFDGPKFAGLWPVRDRTETAARAASQLITRVLAPGTRELDLGAFLRAHEDILKRTFGYVDLVYEPYLEWQPGTPSKGQTAHNPDFMAKRIDGYWDFIELKLPLRTVKRITRGEGAHLRFAQDAYEAISQSAHYSGYFEHRANREYAFKRYRIRVRNPRRLIIVGTAENSDPDLVCRALATAPANTEVYDYDSLVGMYLSRLV